MTLLPITVAVADEQPILLKGVSNLIGSFEGFKVVFETVNAIELLDSLKMELPLPRVFILGVKQERFDFYRKIILDLKKLAPDANLIGFIEHQNRVLISKVFSLGINCILTSNCKPNELLDALNNTPPNEISNQNRNSITRQNTESATREKLSILELQFLSLTCSELTYKEIADKMNLKQRSIDSIRESLFKKLDAVSRTGLVIKGLRNGFISLD